MVMKVFLLVEDAPVVRKVANRILSDLGYLVIEASNAIDALEKCRSQIPDGIIVDWELPRMSGIEFITEFRKIDGSARSKIFYCTCEIAVSDMTRAKRAGATSFLMKPFNREILMHKLAEAGMDIQPVDAVA